MFKWSQENGLKSHDCRRALGVTLMAVVVLVGLSAQSMAQTANRVVSDCNVDLSALKSSVTSSDPAVSDLLVNLQAVTVVIYANNPNFGQPILDNNDQPTGEHTGRVICMVNGVTGVPKAETDPIPDSNNNVDINDVGNGMAIRYTNPTGGGSPNGIRICATSNGNGDCVDADLSPLLP